MPYILPVYSCDRRLRPRLDLAIQLLSTGTRRSVRARFLPYILEHRLFPQQRMLDAHPASTNIHGASSLSLCFSLSRQTSSDLTSMSETDSDGGGPARGVLLWRHVRMIVRGVRGMRGVLGEGSRLERTVAYRAARCEHACCRELYQAAASRCM